MFFIVMASLSLVFMIVIALLEDESKVKRAYAIGAIMALNWLLAAIRTL